MIAMDVRLRALLLTLVLVGVIAALVQLWPQSVPTGADLDSGNPAGEDGQLRRHFDWASTQLRSGHYEQAILGFQAVLEQAPTMPEAYINTGFAHIELQQYQQALQAFQTAIALRPGQVNAYWGLAVSLEGLCDIPGAMGAMRTYIHLAKADDPFLTKARAALWEWEQLKTAATESGNTEPGCNQRDEPKQEQGAEQ